MIEKIIHQIWLGSNSPPTEWLDSWKDKHPNWEYKLWTEKDVASFKWPNSRVQEAYDLAPEFNNNWMISSF